MAECERCDILSGKCHAYACADGKNEFMARASNQPLVRKNLKIKFLKPPLRKRLATR